MCEFSGKTNNFDFYGPNLPKNGFWAWNFKNLSLDSESPPPRYQVCQFPVKMDKFEFFGLNLGKLPKCDILVLTMLRVLQRAGWRLKWAGWRSIELGESWNELGALGWSWVNGLVIPKYMDKSFMMIGHFACYQECHISRFWKYSKVSCDIKTG